MLLPQYLTPFETLAQHLRSVFPFASRAEWRRFKRNQRRYLKKILPAVTDDQTFFRTLEFFLGTLRHGHTRLDRYPTKRWYGPKGLTVQCTNGDFWLFRSRKLLGRIRLIDDLEPEKLLRTHVRRVGGGTRNYRIHQALKFLLFSLQRQPVMISIQRGRRWFQLRAVRTLIKRSISHPRLMIHWLPRRVLYVKIPVWTSSVVTRLDRRMIVWRATAASGLILDLRGNGGGSTDTAFALAAHLLTKPTTFGSVRSRASSSAIRLRERKLMVLPKRPTIDAPAVLLMDTESQSANEIFIAGLKDTGRVVTIGERTAGSSGSPVVKRIPLGERSFTVKIATWRYRRPNGADLEGRGIRPDVNVDPARGHAPDKTLDAARKMIARLRGSQPDASRQTFGRT